MNIYIYILIYIYTSIYIYLRYETCSQQLTAAAPLVFPGQCPASGEGTAFLRVKIHGYFVGTVCECCCFLTWRTFIRTSSSSSSPSSSPTSSSPSSSSSKQPSRLNMKMIQNGCSRKRQGCLLVIIHKDTAFKRLVAGGTLQFRMINHPIHQS